MGNEQTTRERRYIVSILQSRAKENQLNGPYSRGNVAEEI